MAIGALFLGVWLLGFHIGVPLWVMAYMYLFAGTNLPTILLIGTSFELFLVGVLDLVLDVDWFVPKFFEWAGFEYWANEIEVDNVKTLLMVIGAVAAVLVIAVIVVVNRRRQPS